MDVFSFREQVFKPIEEEYLTEQILDLPKENPYDEDSSNTIEIQTKVLKDNGSLMVPNLRSSVVIKTKTKRILQNNGRIERAQIL